MAVELSRRTEMRDRNGYERFLADILDSGVHFHVEVVYHDRRRGPILLGRLHNYDSAVNFSAERPWIQKNPVYQFIGPKDVKFYGVIHWAPEGVRVYSSEVQTTAVPEAPVQVPIFRPVVTPAA